MIEIVGFVVALLAMLLFDQQPGVLAVVLLVTIGVCNQAAYWRWCRAWERRGDGER